MKVNLKNILSLAALGITLLANTVPTWAGSVGIREVSIYTNQVGIYASGSMVGARYSADSRQYIGCSLLTHPNEPPSLGCYARNSAGAYAMCRSLDSKHVEEFQGITDSSYMYFEADLTFGACQRIVIYDSSDQLK